MSIEYQVRAISMGVRMGLHVSRSRFTTTTQCISTHEHKALVVEKLARGLAFSGHSESNPKSSKELLNLTLDS